MVELMTNADKSELRWMIKNGYSFEQIRDAVICSESTIRRYIRALKSKKLGQDRIYLEREKNAMGSVVRNKNTGRESLMVEIGQQCDPCDTCKASTACIGLKTVEGKIRKAKRCNCCGRVSLIQEDKSV
jgi:hypothetical protein